MADVTKARSAFQKYRKQRRKDGFIHKPDYRTAFYAGYLAAEEARAVGAAVPMQIVINKIIDEDPINNWWLERDAFEGWNNS